MAEPRIETAFSTLSSSPQSGSFTMNEMMADIQRYWGNPTTEIQYPISFGRADRLLSQSPSNQIALKVTNVEDPSAVDAEWVAFNESDLDGSEEYAPGFIGWLQRLLDRLTSSSEPEADVRYYVIGSELYTSSGNENFRQFTPHFQMTITGRIGRAENGSVGLHFIVCRLVPQVSGPGGPGASSGARIPPSGGEE